MNGEVKSFTADELKSYSDTVAWIERERIAAWLDCKKDCIGRADLAKGDKCTWSYDEGCSKALAEAIRQGDGTWKS